MITRKVFFMGLQQGNGLFKGLPIGTRSTPVVIGAGQLTIHLRGAILGGNGLQRVNDFLEFVLLMPLLAPL